MAQQVANVFVVEVDGTKLPPEVELQSVVVDDALHVPDMFTLTFRDPSKTAIEASKVKMGARVKIGIRSDAEPAPKPLFEGEVTNIELFVDSGGRLVMVRGYDLSHRLHRGRVTAGYRNQTYSDVAAKIAKRNGLKAGKIDSTSPVHDHIAQTDQTDWDLLSRLASHAGFKVAVDGDKLDFHKHEPAKPVGGANDLSVDEPLTLQVGSTLLRLHASVRATGQVTQVQARGWDTKNKRALVATAPVESASAKIGVKPSEVASAFGSPGWTVPALRFGTQAEIEREAKVTAQFVGNEMAELDGVARGNPALKPGASVKLALAGPPFDGTYVLTTVRHTSDPADGYVTQFKVSGKSDTLLELAGGNGGSNGNGKGGVVPAIVDSVKDPENKCRVRLRFPWLHDDYVSDWSRVSMIGAGGGRGFAWLPEPGDEVLVAFEEGDLARPYVVGGLFNGKDAPHSAPKLDGSTNAVNTRSLVSRKGHRITFNDASDLDGIEISGATGRAVITLLDKDEKIKILTHGEVTISGDKIAIDGTDVEISGSSSLKLSAPNVTVNADAQLELTGAVTSVKGTPLKLN